MARKEMISTVECCTYFQVELSLLNSFEQSGLIEILHEGQSAYVAVSQLDQLEKMIVFYRELEINLEGIEAISHLLNRLNLLQEENKRLRNQLNQYPPE
jgi:hypothetical protein